MFNRSSHRWCAVFTLLVAVYLCACEEGPPPPPAIPPASPNQPPPVDVTPVPCVDDHTFEPGATLPRRLTGLEYRNTVRDLFGIKLPSTINFPPEEEMLGFDNNARALQVTPLHTERMMQAAEFVASAVAADLETYAPCEAGRPWGECVANFIEETGARIWRRPLTVVEVARLTMLYGIGAGEAEDRGAGLSLIIEAMLQSPNFLYRLEQGEPVEEDPTLRKLTAFELASRLSYFLWRTMPDDELFTTALSGDLTKDEVLAEQVDRMLDDPKAQLAFWTFFAQWLHVDQVPYIDRDPRYHPTFDEDDALRMYDQFQDFVERAVWSQDGSVEALFSKPFELAFDPVGVERVGILSQPALLAVTAKPNMTSPVHRGVFVREQLLCTALPPPPADAMAVAPDPDPNLTTRQLFEAHTEDPACAGCHKLIDPLGLGFEHFNEVGQWREMQNGHPVDARGEVVGTTDINGPFYGVDELAHRMATSEQVHRCVTTQVFRYGAGRGEGDGDGCTLESMFSDYLESGYDFRVLVRSFVMHRVFKYRRGDAQ